jgi:hypothetical protein
MKKTYFVNTNAQGNGDHEVHEDGCDWLKKVFTPKYLGQYDNCKPAVAEAKKTYSTANGCKYCCPSCHTR